jgi:hypothetical protein
LDGPSSALAEQGAEFYADAAKTDALIRYAVERFASGEESVEESGSFVDSVLSLVDAAEQSAVGITEFREGARGLRQFSNALAPASNQIVLGAGKFLEGIGVMSTWREPLARLRSESR